MRLITVNLTDEKLRYNSILAAGQGAHVNVVQEPASRVFMADSLIGLLSLKLKCYPSGDPNHRKIQPLGSVRS